MQRKASLLEVAGRLFFVACRVSVLLRCNRLAPWLSICCQICCKCQCQDTTNCFQCRILWSRGHHAWPAVQHVSKHHRPVFPITSKADTGKGTLKEVGTQNEEEQ